MASVARSGPAAQTGGTDARLGTDAQQTLLLQSDHEHRGTGEGTSTAEGLAPRVSVTEHAALSHCPWGTKGFAGKKHRAAEVEFIGTEGSSGTCHLCCDPG